MLEEERKWYQGDTWRKNSQNFAQSDKKKQLKNARNSTNLNCNKNKENYASAKYNKMTIEISLKETNKKNRYISGKKATVRLLAPFSTKILETRKH